MTLASEISKQSFLKQTCVSMRDEDDSSYSICCHIIPPFLEKKVNSTLSTTLLSGFSNNQRLACSSDFRTRRTKKLSVHKPRVGRPKIEVWTAKHQWQENGSKQADLRKDVDAKEAYDGAASVDAFYQNIFERDSIDDKKMDILSTVHFGKGYNNALWNGKRMVYGDGDGKVFNRFTIDLDVIGHELTHGVTQCSARFLYHNQSGALNESISDVFGSMIKQYHNLQTAAEANWLLGENLIKIAKDGSKYALRSLKAPGTAYINHPVLETDLQPSHMQNYLNMADTEEGDWGGVHVNSGIPNHAFYLLAQALGGYSWEKAGVIWYNTIIDKGSLCHPTTGKKLIHPNTNFEEFAHATILTSKSVDPKIENIVRSVWEQVGVLTPPDNNNNNNNNSPVEREVSAVIKKRKTRSTTGKNQENASDTTEAHREKKTNKRKFESLKVKKGQVGKKPKPFSKSETSAGVESIKRVPMKRVSVDKDVKKVNLKDNEKRSTQQKLFHKKRGGQGIHAISLARISGHPHKAFSSQILPSYIQSTALKNTANKSDRKIIEKSIRVTEKIRAQREEM